MGHIKKWANVVGYIALGYIVIGLEWVEQELIKIASKLEENGNGATSNVTEGQVPQGQTELRNGL